MRKRRKPRLPVSKDAESTDLEPPKVTTCGPEQIDLLNSENSAKVYGEASSTEIKDVPETEPDCTENIHTVTRDTSKDCEAVDKTVQSDVEQSLSGTDAWNVNRSGDDLDNDSVLVPPFRTTSIGFSSKLPCSPDPENPMLKNIESLGRNSSHFSSPPKYCQSNLMDNQSLPSSVTTPNVQGNTEKQQLHIMCDIAGQTSQSTQPLCDIAGQTSQSTQPLCDIAGQTSQSAQPLCDIAGQTSQSAQSLHFSSGSDKTELITSPRQVHGEDCSVESIPGNKGTQPENSIDNSNLKGTVLGDEEFNSGSADNLTVSPAAQTETFSAVKVQLDDTLDQTNNNSDFFEHQMNVPASEFGSVMQTDIPHIVCNDNDGPAINVSTHKSCNTCQNFIIGSKTGEASQVNQTLLNLQMCMNQHCDLIDNTSKTENSSNLETSDEQSCVEVSDEVTSNRYGISALDSFKFCDCSETQGGTDIPVEQVFVHDGQMYQLPDAKIIRIGNLEFYSFLRDGSLQIPLASFLRVIGKEVKNIFKSVLNFKSFHSLTPDEICLMEQKCSIYHNSTNQDLISLETLKEICVLLLNFSPDSTTLKMLAFSKPCQRVLGTKMRCSGCGLSKRGRGMVKTYIPVDQTEDSNPKVGATVGTLKIGDVGFTCFEMNNKTYISLKDIIQCKILTLRVLQDRMKTLKSKVIPAPKDIEEYCSIQSQHVHHTLWIDMVTLRCIICMGVVRKLECGLAARIARGESTFNPSYNLLCEDTSHFDQTFAVNPKTGLIVQGYMSKKLKDAGLPFILARGRACYKAKSATGDEKVSKEVDSVLENSTEKGRVHVEEMGSYVDNTCHQSTHAFTESADCKELNQNTQTDKKFKWNGRQRIKKTDNVFHYYFGSSGDEQKQTECKSKEKTKKKLNKKTGKRSQDTCQESEVDSHIVLQPGDYIVSDYETFCFKLEAGHVGREDGGSGFIKLQSEEEQAAAALVSVEGKDYIGEMEKENENHPLNQSVQVLISGVSSSCMKDNVKIECQYLEKPVTKSDSISDAHLDVNGISAVVGGKTDRDNIMSCQNQAYLDIDELNNIKETDSAMQEILMSHQSKNIYQKPIDTKLESDTVKEFKPDCTPKSSSNSELKNVVDCKGQDSEHFLYGDLLDFQKRYTRESENGSHFVMDVKSERNQSSADLLTFSITQESPSTNENILAEQTTEIVKKGYETSQNQSIATIKIEHDNLSVVASDTTETKQNGKFEDESEEHEQMKHEQVIVTDDMKENDTCQEKQNRNEQSVSITNIKEKVEDILNDTKDTYKEVVNMAQENRHYSETEQNGKLEDKSDDYDQIKQNPNVTADEMKENDTNQEMQNRNEQSVTIRNIKENVEDNMNVNALTDQEVENIAHENQHNSKRVHNGQFEDESIEYGQMKNEQKVDTDGMKETDTNQETLNGNVQSVTITNIKEKNEHILNDSVDTDQEMKHICQRNQHNSETQQNGTFGNKSDGYSQMKLEHKVAADDMTENEANQENQNGNVHFVSITVKKDKVEDVLNDTVVTNKDVENMTQENHYNSETEQNGKLEDEIEEYGQMKREPKNINIGCKQERSHEEMCREKEEDILNYKVDTEQEVEKTAKESRHNSERVRNGKCEDESMEYGQMKHEPKVDADDMKETDTNQEIGNGNVQSVTITNIKEKVEKVLNDSVDTDQEVKNIAQENELYSETEQSGKLEDVSDEYGQMKHQPKNIDIGCKQERSHEEMHREMEENIKKYLVFIYVKEGRKQGFRVKKFLEGAEKVFPALFLPNPEDPETKLKRVEFMKAAARYMDDMFHQHRQRVQERKRQVSETYSVADNINRDISGSCDEKVNSKSVRDRNEMMVHLVNNSKNTGKKGEDLNCPSKDGKEERSDKLSQYCGRKEKNIVSVFKDEDGKERDPTDSSNVKCEKKKYIVNSYKARDRTEEYLRVNFGNESFRNQNDTANSCTVSMERQEDAVNSCTVRMERQEDAVNSCTVRMERQEDAVNSCTVRMERQEDAVNSCTVSMERQEDAVVSCISRIPTLDNAEVINKVEHDSDIGERVEGSLMCDTGHETDDKNLRKKREKFDVNEDKFLRSPGDMIVPKSVRHSGKKLSSCYRKRKGRKRKITTQNTKSTQKQLKIENDPSSADTSVVEEVRESKYKLRARKENGMKVFENKADQDARRPPLKTGKNKYSRKTRHSNTTTEVANHNMSLSKTGTGKIEQILENQIEKVPTKNKFAGNTKQKLENSEIVRSAIEKTVVAGNLENALNEVNMQGKKVTKCIAEEKNGQNQLQAGKNSGTCNGFTVTRVGENGIHARKGLVMTLKRNKQNELFVGQKRSPVSDCYVRLKRIKLLDDAVSS